MINSSPPSRIGCRRTARSISCPVSFGAINQVRNTGRQTTRAKAVGSSEDSRFFMARIHGWVIQISISNEIRDRAIGSPVSRPQSTILPASSPACLRGLMRQPIGKSQVFRGQCQLAGLWSTCQELGTGCDVRGMVLATRCKDWKRPSLAGYRIFVPRYSSRLANGISERCSLYRRRSEFVPGFGPV